MEQIIHLGSRLMLELRDDVAVRVHREPDLAVAQDLHHHPWIDPLCQEE